MRRRARERRARGERGAVLVEAALIFPILMLITFGIIEYGLAFKNVSTVSSATRSGARTGSALPRTANYEDSVLAAVATDLQALSNATPLEMWIYKANAVDGGPPVARPSSCSTNCILFTDWDGTTFATRGGGGWPGSSQRACQGSADTLGVYLKVEHNFVSNFFRSTQDLNEQTVMRLEPIAVSQAACQP